MEKVFVYGTLRNPAIRNTIAGRKIASFGVDSVSGFQLSSVSDGGESYPIIIKDGDSKLEIEGEILEVSELELQKFDIYEGDLYIRQRIKLRSGTEAWVYIKE